MGPIWELPTAITFLPVAGVTTLQPPAGVSIPSLPAANTMACMGFCRMHEQWQRSRVNTEDSGNLVFEPDGLHWGEARPQPSDV